MLAIILSFAKLIRRRPISLDIIVDRAVDRVAASRLGEIEAGFGAPKGTLHINSSFNDDLLFRALRIFK